SPPEWDRRRLPPLPGHCPEEVLPPDPHRTPKTRDEQIPEPIRAVVSPSRCAQPIRILRSMVAPKNKRAHYSTESPLVRSPRTSRPRLCWYRARTTHYSVSIKPMPMLDRLPKQAPRCR